ncbi:hypothetical protein POM88_023526 [Heracleum sosnowskyi]|uniref:FANCI helical domain-containing protein n=1 Tax=Heracleum sosnowskyi TaxID=360622 RepID=A0AAD8IHV3_9APIA|nr:hypothetical protein POM88_023526 [Heracleum sosnowskyi]
MEGFVVVVYPMHEFALAIYDLALSFLKDSTPRINEGDSGKFCIQEPLDCLLSCVSWILVMQPFGSDPSDARHSFGFYLAQENEAGRNLSTETFSSVLSKIQNFLRTANFEEPMEAVTLPQLTGNSTCAFCRSYAFLYLDLLRIEEVNRGTATGNFCIS